MPTETETVTGNPAQEQNTEEQKDNTEASRSEVHNGQSAEVQVSSENNSQPSVEACILKTNIPVESQSEPPTEPEVCTSSNASTPSRIDTSVQTWTVNASLRPKSPEVVATEAFLIHEQGSFEPEIDQPKITSKPSEPESNQVSQETDVPSEPSEVPEKELVPQTVEPRTPANSEASETGALSSGEGAQDLVPTQVVEEPPSNDVLVPVVEEYTTVTTINGDVSEEPPKEVLPVSPEPAPLTNGQSNGECKLEPRKIPEPEPEELQVERNQVLIDTIANELIAEDYKLPDVVEVKKHFEYIEPTHNDVSTTPPKKGALLTRLDAQSVKKAYEDVRYDGSETQWAVFKFEGPTIVTSATGADFSQFKSHFGEDQRAFGYIRVQTGDELSKRAKFLFVTWVGPSVSVLKRAKMSTDKALMKDILSNFAVELQTENISDINLENFETELDKAAGAHYGTGVRG